MAISHDINFLWSPENYANNITALDIYPSGAKFTFSVEPDENSHFKAILPGDFDKNSIRLLNPHEVQGNIQAEKYLRPNEWIPEGLKDLNDQLQEREKIIDELTSKKAALEQTLELLKNSDPNKSPEGPLSYIRQAQELRLNTEKELREINSAITQANEQKQFISINLELMKPKINAACIVVSGRSSSTVKFEAFTNSAKWWTGYIMNLNSSSGDIDLIMYITAFQKTGLDYSGSITFHTKTPQHFLRSPELNPLRVELKPKEQRPDIAASDSYQAVEYDISSNMPSLSSPQKAPEETRFPPSTSIQETLLDTAIQLKDSITGDGRYTVFSVIKDSMILKSTPEIILIPEQRDNAWIIANMSADNESLIPGKADIRVDGQLSGTMKLSEFQTSGGQIPFGYIEQITIKKEALFNYEDSSSLEGLSTSGYKLEITNNTGESRKITVRDRLPLVTNNDIKLDIKRIEPPETERDSCNILTWKIEVPAHGKANIIVDYTLSYPSIFRYSL